MKTEKIEFQGKDVTEAIGKACSSLNVAQEDLDIEVLATGSLGVFGLCRQKARLRVSLKKKEPSDEPVSLAAELGLDTVGKDQERQPPSDSLRKKSKNRPQKSAKKVDIDPQDEISGVDVEPESENGEYAEPEFIVEKVGPETLEIIRTDLTEMLDLMGCPSEVAVSVSKKGIAADITGAHVELLVGSDGRVLDSLEYLLRKMVSKKISEKVTILIDAGNYRATRLEELKDLGKKLAGEVKENGKTKTIPSLNPTERRAVHLALQDDPDVKSRSVGDGLFKKILIFKAGGEAPRKGPSRKGRRR